MGNRAVAIIPARGGSKRLPRKNILPINDRPMLSYPVKTAVESGLFDEVIVSTEDSEIASIARKEGASVLKRPKELAQDNNTMAEVCRHVLLLPEYESVSRFCCIYATAIFLRPDDLLKARDLMDEEPVADFVTGVSAYNYHPYRALKTESGYLSRMWPEYVGRAKEFPDPVSANGTLHWADRDAFLQMGSFYGKRLKGYELAAVDIDNRADYEKAKALAEEKSFDHCEL